MTGTNAGRHQRSRFAIAQHHGSTPAMTSASRAEEERPQQPDAFHAGNSAYIRWARLSRHARCRSGDNPAPVLMGERHPDPVEAYRGHGEAARTPAHQQRCVDDRQGRRWLDSSA